MLSLTTSTSKCQVLDQNGKQCSRKAVNHIKYFGDNEIYRYQEDKRKDKQWVKVAVCKIHSEGEKL